MKLYDLRRLPTSRKDSRATAHRRAPLRHLCKVPKQLQTEGYGNSIGTCMEDDQGQLWVTSDSSRRMTQVNFCPFCGFRARKTPTKRQPSAMSKELTTPPDRPDAVWKRFNPGYQMLHCMFGRVTVLATDGVHAKVRLRNSEIITVHCTNMITPPMIEIPTFPKVGKEKVKSEKAKQKEQQESELSAKYMNLAKTLLG